MIDHISNNQIVLVLLMAVVLAAGIWHVIESHWDSRIFEAGRSGVFRNLHTKAAMYAFDHVDGLVPVDVRSKNDFLAHHIAGAVSASWNEGNLDESFLDGLSRDTPILLYCEGGFASRRSIETVKGLGFHTIYHLHRGFKSWRLYGGPIEDGVK